MVSEEQRVAKLMTCTTYLIAARCPRPIQSFSTASAGIRACWLVLDYLPRWNHVNC